MADALDETIALTLKRNPWLMAKPWSFWVASGTYAGANRGTFHNCMMVALPHYATGGAVVFRMIGTLDDIVTPGEITHATEYQLVPVSPKSEQADR